MAVAAAVEPVAPRRGRPCETLHASSPGVAASWATTCSQSRTQETDTSMPATLNIPRLPRCRRGARERLALHHLHETGERPRDCWDDGKVASGESDESAACFEVWHYRHPLGGDCCGGVSCPRCGRVTKATHGVFYVCRCGHTIKVLGASLYIWDSNDIPRRTEPEPPSLYDRAVDGMTEAGAFGELGSFLLMHPNRRAG